MIVSDLFQFLPLHDSGLEDMPYAACSHPTSQTYFKGKVVDVLRVDATNIELAKWSLLQQVHSTLSSTINDGEEVFGIQVS